MGINLNISKELFARGDNALTGTAIEFASAGAGNAMKLPQGSLASDLIKSAMSTGLHTTIEYQKMMAGQSNNYAAMATSDLSRAGELTGTVLSSFNLFDFNKEANSTDQTQRASDVIAGAGVFGRRDENGNLVFDSATGDDYKFGAGIKSTLAGYAAMLGFGKGGLWEMAGNWLTWNQFEQTVVLQDRLDRWLASLTSAQKVALLTSSYLPGFRSNEKLKLTDEQEENFKKKVYPYTNRVDTEKKLSELEFEGYDTTELRAWAAKMRGNIDMTPEQAKQVADHRITIGLDKPSFADQVKNVWDGFKQFIERHGENIAMAMLEYPIQTSNGNTNLSKLDKDRSNIPLEYSNNITIDQLLSDRQLMAQYMPNGESSELLKELMKNGFTGSSQGLWCVTASYYISLKAIGANVESDIAKYFINNKDKGYVTINGGSHDSVNLAESYKIDGRQVIRDEPVYLIEYSKIKDRFTALNDYLISNEPKAVMLRMSHNDSFKSGHTLSLIRDGESYRVIDTAGYATIGNVYSNNSVYNPKDDFSKSVLYNTYNNERKNQDWKFLAYTVVR